MNVEINDIIDGKHQIYFDRDDYKNIYRKYSRNLLMHKDNPYHLLLCAKACFLQREYSLCIETLQKIKPNFSTKILYERQTLLIKVLYLNKAQRWQQQIQQAVINFQKYANKCPGTKILQSHRIDIRQLRDTANLKKQIQINQQQKKKMQQQLKILPLKTVFQGMPSYLISTQWNEKFQKFIFKDTPNPGPITNFQLINHIFEYRKQPSQKKSYMDNLLFPIQYRFDYFILNKEHWQYISKCFGGVPVQRMYLKYKYSEDGDNLIRTLIQYQHELHIFQWQKGLYWQRSIFPTLMKILGEGQLKQQTRNKQYLIIQPGLAHQPQTKLKYVLVDHKKIGADTPQENQRKKKILMGFDMQGYKMEDCKNYGRVGLANLGNTCYMNSALQCLSQITEFSGYFLMNQHLEKINLSNSNVHGSYGEITCALADIFKRLWFCSEQTRYIDPTPFKRVFGQRYIDFSGYEQQDAQQFLMFLLNCIHDDLNQKSNIKLPRESVTDKTYDQVKASAISHHTKHNHSIITQKFVGFHSETITCNTCNFTSHRFQDFIMFHVQVPEDSPKIQLYYVNIEKDSKNCCRRVTCYIEGLGKFEEIYEILREEFGVGKDHEFYGVEYDVDFQVLREIDKDQSVQEIYKELNKKNSKIDNIFIYQVKKLFKQQELALINFYYSGTAYHPQHKLDGFPRIAPIPIQLKPKQKHDDLKEYLLDYIVQTKSYSIITRQQKFEKIGKISVKSTKKHFYDLVVSVETKRVLRLFNFVPYHKILGGNSREKENTLETCLAGMSENQVIDQNQGWYCEKCQAISEAHKADKIYNTNTILLFDFKRFTEKGKISTKIKYPIRDFDITPFVLDRKERLVYELVGVVLHRGSLNYGHYTAYCYNERNKKWYYYDDQAVREVSEEDIVDQNAYILMYKRK